MDGSVRQHTEYGITVLEPDDGFNWITNDEVWSTKVYLGTNDKVENWHDTNDDPPIPPEPEEVTK